MGSNPSPSLVVRTGRAPKYRACWEVPTSEKDMVQVGHLLEEIANLSAFKLTGPRWPCPTASGWCSRFRIESTPTTSTGVAQTRLGGRTAWSPRKKLKPGRPHDARDDPGQKVPEGTLPEAVDKRRECPKPLRVVLLLF